MTSETLETLYANHQGKVSDKWASYLREYQRLLGPINDQPLTILEIGIQNGGSLELWARWFRNAARIIGCDIDARCADLTFDDPRIALVIGDANSDAVEEAVRAESTALDVIIDDGSHSSGDIIKSFARYFPMLKDGGLYIIEDLHCSYWHDFEGGIFHPYSSMNFFKRLADVVNHEHWGVPKMRGDLVRAMTVHVGVSLDDEQLAHVHSVEFLNSLCVVRKSRPAENLLGERRVSGNEAPIKSDLRDVSGPVPLPAADESRNPWSNAAEYPEDELLMRRTEVVTLSEQVASLSNQLSGMESTSRDREQRLDRAISDHVAQIEGLQRQLSERETQLAELARAVEVERASWHRALGARERQLADQAGAMHDLISARERQERAYTKDRDAMRQRSKQLEAELANAREMIRSLQSSLSWRVTKPIRESLTAIEHLPERLPEGGVSRAARRVRKVLRQKGVGGATERLLELVTGRGKLGQPTKLTPTRRTGKPSARSTVRTLRPENYAEWLRLHEALTSEERAGLAARALAFQKQPLISVVMPTYNSNVRWLSEAVRSVQRQIYPFWELCIVDDASTDIEVRFYLEELMQEDPRVRVCFRKQNGHISLATNTGLEMAKGDWIAFLDHDDVLREHALFWVVDAINAHSQARLIFSDEDKIDDRGRRAGPYFKSDFNADLFHSYNMICHLSVYDAALVREVGGCRKGFEGAQDYDLALRCIERIRSDQIHHIPRVLYSWRMHALSTAVSDESKPYAGLAGKRALDEHFERTGARARAEVLPGPAYRIHYQMPEPAPLVSIIVPTRNAENLVRLCIETLVRRTAYDNFEILLVDNGSDNASAVAYFKQLADDGVVRLVRDDRPFNYSALNNAAVKVAQGDVICLLNNDIEVISADWLREMVSIAVQDGVGAVGARLWYPNGTLQHAGLIVGNDGVATHAHRCLSKGDGGFFNRAALTQSVSAVTAACLVVRKHVYQEVGGLNESNLKVAFNDVDFCLRVRAAGYRNVWTPFAELIHHESATRGNENTPEKLSRLSGEAHFMYARWAPELERDPAYSPNLANSAESFAYAWPSRVPRLRAI